MICPPLPDRHHERAVIFIDIAMTITGHIIHKQVEACVWQAS